MNLFLDRCRTDTVLTEFEPALKKLIRKFYVDHVVPFAKYPYEERPSVELLIGLHQRHWSRLWVTARTEVHPVFGCATVGAGANHAKALLDRLTVPWVNTNVARIVAAYIIYATKGIEGCGGETHLVTVSGDIASYLPRDLIEEMEKLFTAYGGVEARAFHYALGYPSSHPAGDLAKLNSWLEDLRNDFEKLAMKM